MNDKDRKFLTEWMGECWHNPSGETHYNHGLDYPRLTCRYCGCLVTTNRTFDTPEDSHWLKKKLVEKGEWLSFQLYLQLHSIKPTDLLTETLADILTTPSLFCDKVVEYLQEESDESQTCF
jgi:hypothetical protein